MMVVLTAILGADTVALSRRSIARTRSFYPYPVIKYSALARPGDTFAKACSRLTKPTIVDLEGVAHQSSDFAAGAWDHSRGDNGAWSFYTPNVAGFLNANLSIAPMTSTKGALVHELPDGAPNQYVGLRLDPGNTVNMLPAFLTGKYTATTQGHNYSGVQLYATKGGLIGPLVVKGIPSSKGGGPPDETFSLAGYHARDLTFQDCEVDGKNTNGVAVAASGFSANGPATTVTHIRSNAHDCINGSGFTHYKNTGWTFVFTDCRSTNTGYAGFNFEQCGGSTATFTRPSVGGSPVDMVLDSTNGFMTVTITDPVFTDARVAGKDKLVICVHPTYDYALPAALPNLQIDAASNNHVTLIVEGVSRPDLIQFVSSYTPNG
jgi:hypothetical protein